MLFITIPSLSLKILKDSGASNSIINSKPANEYFQNFFFNKPFSVKSLNQVVASNKNISYPILREFGINCYINFHVLDWHDNFDALLGSEDLRKLGAKINYNNQTLQIKNIKIPFFMELDPRNFQPFKQTFEKYLKLPVNINDDQF